MNNVDRGRWKFVISTSTARNRNPGRINNDVAPSNGRTVPSSAAALSSNRKDVVPTATIRPPLIMTTRWQTAVASGRMWVLRMMV